MYIEFYSMDLENLNKTNLYLNDQINSIELVNLHSLSLDNPSLFVNDLTILNNDNSFIFHAKNWLYNFTENFFAYNYDIVYYLYENYIYEDASYVKNKKYWSGSITYNQYTFMSSIILDQIYALGIISLPFFVEFFKHFFNSFEMTNFIESHPEYYLIFKEYTMLYYLNYFTGLYSSLFLLNVHESFLTPVMLIPHWIFIIGSIAFFFLLYFSYFNTHSSEENIIDHDYLLFNVTVESEEEVGSLDDMLLSSVILIYIFLWFFWIHAWSSISITPRLTMSVFLFPFIYYIIICIPTSLLFDYGLYFLTYLNGVGKSSVLMLELLFDYIAVSIFYLRLIVQNVRLAFMLFTYTELHELILFYVVDRNMFMFNESFVDAWDNVKSEFAASNWYIVLSLPMLLLKWLYELFHTFFMVIFQFIAFFAMIFWLFLFLYTMFVMETQENYFSYKRILRKDFFKKKINLKSLFN